MQATLSEEERARASRFRFEADRRRFVITRANLRRLLGEYLGCCGTEINFCYSSHGKPSLSESASDIRFNVTHSGDVALLGFVQSCEIGIDVEQVRQNEELDKLAERFFSLREREQVLGLTGEEKQTAFYRIWTRKEAYVKALGCGISLALDSFDTSQAGAKPADLRVDHLDAASPSRWRLWDVDAGEGYSGAVAVEAFMAEPRVCLWLAQDQA